MNANVNAVVTPQTALALPQNATQINGVICNTPEQIVTEVRNLLRAKVNLSAGITGEINEDGVFESFKNGKVILHGKGIECNVPKWDINKDTFEQYQLKLKVAAKNLLSRISMHMSGRLAHQIDEMTNNVILAFDSLNPAPAQVDAPEQAAN